MKTIRTIITMTLAALLVTGCDWYTNQTVVGTGNIETMEVQVSDFTGVSVTGRCNVDIRTGETRSVEYSAQKQVLEVMTHEVRNGILYIGIRPGYSVHTREAISADIVIPALSSVAVTGAGDFVLNGSKQDLLDIYISGTGNINASALEVDDCMIRISGAGDCDVWVNNSLDIDISGVGNISYKGNPKLTSDVSGVGNVVKLGS